MKRRMSPVAVLALILAYCSSAQAVEYRDVNRTASQISFTYQQLGQRVYGTFSDFEGSLNFDTQRPDAGHALLKIQLASIDAGSSDANDELQRASWFDTATFPVGIYESTGVTALGGNRYKIDGNLTIKGVTKPVTLKVTHYTTMAHPMLKKDSIGANATTVIKRSEFNAGKYAPHVGDDVTITVSLEAIKN